MEMTRKGPNRLFSPQRRCPLLSHEEYFKVDNSQELQFIIIQLHDLHYCEKCPDMSENRRPHLIYCYSGCVQHKDVVFNIKSSTCMDKFNMGMVNNNSFDEDLLHLQINDCFWLHIPPSGDSTLRILHNV